MSERTDAVLAAIDGALADVDLPDAMRWSPAPGQVYDAGWAVYDGECVPLPPQDYEQVEPPPDDWISPPVGPRAAVRISEHAAGLATDHERRPYMGPDCVQLHHGRCDNPYGICLCTCHDHPSRALVAPPRPGRSPEDSAAALRSIRQVFDRVAEELVPAVRALREAIGQLQIPDLLPAKPAPTDRRVAALEARRRRHTGPPRPGPERSRAPRWLMR